MSARDEWETPDWVLDLARTILGAIDLDPASSAQANARVKAARYYDKEANGLVRPWEGRVWCNPPYSTTLLRAFVNKAIVERDRYRACLLLINADPSTQAFQALCRTAAGVWFPQRRINFVHPTLARSQNRYPQAMFLLESVTRYWPEFCSALEPAGVVLACDNGLKAWAA